ncbi:MAG: M42 family metallopeptidase [Chitinophagales bacterium]|nr:M42 family metallopeptidase [Chitinophagales bacterium]MCO5279748.1 M42 family metallopeptidase [Chitinophagales bacterium]OJV24354.1 MAG: endoglucanase [Bacteroidetes bacterium 37-13]HRN93251.1 M42 family metallopeptidase [Chitinophagales bacterium]HRP40297.1 M42 family metallopeptidase [Chitinophagales bacterium]
MINVTLLKETCETPGISGFEQKVRELVTHELQGFTDKLYTDAMGNLIAVKKGKSSEKRVMAAAHMDEIGFIVNMIDDKGFLRFYPIGGFDPKTLTAQRVIVHGKKDIIGVMGSKPIHLMTPEERGKLTQIKDYFIDLGLPKSEVEKIVEIGSPVSRQRELIEMGECVNCKSLDNRVSVFILMEVLKEMKNTEIPYDFYGVFTVQEEVGIRGAHVAAHHINPDFSFGLDTTIAFDTPEAKPEDNITKLGEGTGIKIMDSSTICDYRMVRYMKALAAKHNIKWQPELLPAGGTDTAGMQRMATNGTIAGAVSIPTRHIHSVIEMSHKADIRASIDLLKASVSELDSFDWKF